MEGSKRHYIPVNLITAVIKTGTWASSS